MAEYWLKCTACKTEIAFGAKHWVCSVSTCNRSRFPLKFCSVVCWDIHLADARHRDAGAIEARAPTREAWQREQADAPRATPAPPPARPPVSAPVQARPATVPGSPPPRTGPAPTSDSVQPRPSSQSDSVPRPLPAETTRVGAAPAPTPTPAPAVRRVVGDASPASAAAVEGVTLSEVTDRDILIVVSKMKKYIKDRSGFNCSDAVADMLSDHVRLLCDEAIRAAARDERKTVLDRDVTRARR
jgi:histone H3/H4